MKRHVIALTVTLMIIASMAMSKPGHSLADEQPAQPQEKSNGNVEAGKALYTTFCQKCHAANGEGNPRMYKLVKATVVHLGSKQAQDQTDDFIRKSMTEGYKKMEKVTQPRTLTTEEVDNVLAFVRTLKQ